jgi:hypothetical protein
VQFANDLFLKVTHDRTLARRASAWDGPEFCYDSRIRRERGDVRSCDEIEGSPAP